jgi:hypothetical protein
MRQRRSQHRRLAFSAGRGRGAQVNARLFDELRDRRDPSPGAPSISAEMAGGTHPTRRPQTFAKLVASRL